MRERTAEGEAMEWRRGRRWRIARSVVDDASRLLSGPGLFARRTDRWAIVSRWLQHVRGCLKYRDRTGPPSLSAILSLASSPPPPPALYEGPGPLFRGKQRQKRVPTETHTEGRAPVHLSPPLDGEYGHRLMGSSRFSPLFLLLLLLLLLCSWSCLLHDYEHGWTKIWKFSRRINKVRFDIWLSEIEKGKKETRLIKFDQAFWKVQI